MRQLAEDFCTSSTKRASDFMQTGFYVDDGLISLSSDEEVIDLIDKTVSLCCKGGLDLHKFSSNSKFVMQYVSERYNSELSTDLPGPTIERLLGVVWCVESDTLQFRIIVVELLCTVILNSLACAQSLMTMVSCGVGGRLDHASTLSYIEKHPIVIPRAKDGKVSKLIITHYHEKCLHQGRGVTVNTDKK